MCCRWGGWGKQSICRWSPSELGFKERKAQVVQAATESMTICVYLFGGESAVGIEDVRINNM